MALDDPSPMIGIHLSNLEIDPYSPQVLNLAGVMFEMREDYEQARRYYEQFDFVASPADPLHLLVLLKDIRGRVKE